MSALPERFSDAERDSFYKILALRRDVRSFRAGEIDDATLERILRAAQQAPSVGYSQPWGFVVLRDLEKRARIRESFLRCREAEAARFPEARREHYLRHRLEGILESSLNLCVVADLRRREDVILGTTVQPESIRASVICAVQNLWLAARAEGLGVGWVSIVEPARIRHELALPAGVDPVAYLCIGYAETLSDRPLLEETGWAKRRPLAQVLHQEAWRAAPEQPRSPEEGEAAGAGMLDRAVFSGATQTAVAPNTGTLRMGTRAGSETHSTNALPAFDEAARAKALEHQRELTKPHGSLGRLEAVAAWYAGAHGLFPPPVPERSRIVVFAADHGVAAHGVSAYPSTLTAAMCANLLRGGAAISVLAEQLDLELELIDVGVSGDLSALPIRPRWRFTKAKIGAGTDDFTLRMAMSPSDAQRAIEVGMRAADRAFEEGCTLIGAGELGIGNTTSAAALIATLLDLSPNEITGYGTGIDESNRRRKVRLIEQALDLHRPTKNDPLHLLASVGGFELGALAGFYLQAARRRLPVVVDGYLGGAAALLAKAFDEGVGAYLLLSHASAEAGSPRIAEALGQRPLIDLGLRLGEGTGAALALDWVRKAVALQMQMATFATASSIDQLRPDAE